MFSFGSAGEERQLDLYTVVQEDNFRKMSSSSISAGSLADISICAIPNISATEFPWTQALALATATSDRVEYSCSRTKNTHSLTAHQGTDPSNKRELRVFVALRRGILCVDG